MDQAVIASNVYRDFAHSVEKFQKSRGSPDTIVSADGLAANFGEICKRRAAMLAADRNATDEDRRMLLLEANTWALLQRVYEFRRKRVEDGRSAQDLLKTNPYTPAHTLYHAWLNHSPRLGELAEVQTWLETTYRPNDKPLLMNEYWKFTRMDLTQKRKQGQTTKTDYVKTLDPDATNRTGEAGVLNADDAEEEKALLNALYQLVRAGRIEEAARLCEGSARQWRAAVIRGMYHLRWDDLENLRDPMSDEVREAPWSGNRRWLLWRKTCKQAALAPALPTADRALHAAIAPSILTLNGLLPMCTTWEDHLWARLAALIGDRVETKLGKTTGGFWNRGTLLDQLALLDQLEADKKPEKDQDAEWESLIARQLDELGDLAVDTTVQAEDFLRRTQLGIIRQRTRPLLAEVEGTFDDPAEALSTSSIRFFAHLWIFLTMINAIGDNTPTTSIVERYIEILKTSGDRDLVALYTSFLGQAAVKKYADFLANLPISTSKVELERALRSAASYHLDVRQVAEEASRLSRDRAAQYLAGEPPTRLHFSKTDAEIHLTDGEQHMIRSLAWLRFHPSTQDLILRKSNDDTRWLLCRGRVRAAWKLCENIPNSIISSANAEQYHEVEYMLYRKLFGVWELFGLLEKVLGAPEPRTALDADGKGYWKRRMEDDIQGLFEAATDVMIADWGVDSVGIVAMDTTGQVSERVLEVRMKELLRLRKMYIPEITIRLTRQLSEARRYVPSATRLVTKLANLVADGKDKLHLDFVDGASPSRLAEYLQAIKEAILEGMDGVSDPFLAAV